jgi:prepilin-type N-terminal cleavage/methylation domain-containing protein
MNSAHTNRAFTLVEVLIAAALGTVLIAMVLSFFIFSLRGLNASNQRMNLGYEISKFTDELSAHASRSGQCILYKTANSADFNGINPAVPSAAEFPDRQIRRVENPDSPQPIDHTMLNTGGDFAVFVYFEFPKPPTQRIHRIIRIEGYYLQPLAIYATQKIGRVRKLVIDLASAPSTLSVEQILTANSSGSYAWDSEVGRVSVSTSFPLVRALSKPEAIDITDVRGIAATIPRLFYMSAERNITISGQHFSGTGDVNTNDERTLTNAFYFNITPRTT